MGIRYSNRGIIRNRDKKYNKKFREKAKKFLDHYNTPKLKHPTGKQIASLQVIDYTWSTGDSFTKLSDEYYGSIKFWWVIAWFNQVPTKFQLNNGDVVGIPLPLEQVINYMGV